VKELLKQMSLSDITAKIKMNDLFVRFTRADDDTVASFPNGLLINDTGPILSTEEHMNSAKDIITKISNNEKYDLDSFSFPFDEFKESISEKYIFTDQSNILKNVMKFKIDQLAKLKFYSLWAGDKIVPDLKVA
jgi:hypothetical protein